MIVKEEIQLNVELDGSPMKIKSSNLPVNCPILSVRRIIKKGNDVGFNDTGGFIRNRTTGRMISFVERKGVYFVNMKILGAVVDEPADQKFGRHGE